VTDSRFASFRDPRAVGRRRAPARIALLVLGIVVWQLASAPARAAEEANLLRNPSAEEGTLVSPAAWDTTMSDMPTVRFAWDGQEAHGGGRSLYILNTSDVIPLWHNWSQSLLGVNELGGKELTLRAWVKTRAVTGKAYILLQAYRDTVFLEAAKAGIPRLQMRTQMNIKPADDPQLELGWARKQTSGDHPEWTPLEVHLYVPPSTNALFVRAGLLGVGEAWFDDLSLTAGPARPERPFPLGKNLLADPGFEGNLDDWDFSMPPVESVRIRADAVAHSGLQSCLIESQRRWQMEIWTHAFQVFNTRALSGKRVRLSGWYKSEGLKNTFACFSIYATGMYGAFHPVVSNAWSGTNDWTFASYETDIPANTYTVWARAVLNTGAGKVWFDDLKFEVLGDSPRPAAASPAKKKAPTTK
jgi:hypothetical protein